MLLEAAVKIILPVGRRSLGSLLRTEISLGYFLRTLKPLARGANYRLKLLHPNLGQLMQFLEDSAIGLYCREFITSIEIIKHCSYFNFCITRMVRDGQTLGFLKLLLDCGFVYL